MVLPDGAEPVGYAWMVRRFALNVMPHHREGGGSLTRGSPHEPANCVSSPLVGEGQGGGGDRTAPV